MDKGRVLAGGVVDFRFGKGHDLDFGTPPDQRVAIHCSVSSAALLSDDFPGSIFDMKVPEGGRVRRGQTVCVDRRHPSINFVSPAAGKIAEIRLGLRRRVHAVVIALEGEDNTPFDVRSSETDAAALRALLLRSGLWTAFRTRPYGRVPAPADIPSAIFVTAIDTNPSAVNPRTVLSTQQESFQRGTLALLLLTNGPVFLCQPPGPSLAADHERVKVARFSGPHPSGLAGTHIHHLMPVSSERSVWHISYQDVVALGHLLATGQTLVVRTLSVAGPGLETPQLVTAPLGARLADVLSVLPFAGKPARASVVSGSVLSGRRAEFLGRHHLQVTVLAPPKNPSQSKTAVSRLMQRFRSTGADAMIPTEALEGLLPLNLLPAPLMRALSVGDMESAEKLGCLELIEEDMSLLSWRCSSSADYGLLLRQVLDQLQQERNP